MNVLILEDLENTRNTLDHIVLSCTGVDNVFSCGKKEEALVYAMDYSIDLFLLDIVLDSQVNNDNSGIIFAENLRKLDKYKLTPIIFITTLMGLERELLKKVHCYDYIEKPIGDGKMVREHIEEVLSAISSGKKTSEREQIPIHYDGIGYMVYLDQVMYIESKRGVLHIHLVDDEISLPNFSAKKFMQSVKHTKFLEPVYGTWVNKDYIESVDFRNCEVYITKSDCVIPIGGRKYKKFKEEYFE